MKPQQPDPIKLLKGSVHISEPQETSEIFLGVISETKSQDDRHVRDFFEEMNSGKYSNHPLAKDPIIPPPLKMDIYAEEPVEKIIITPREQKTGGLRAVKEEINKEKDKKVLVFCKN